jgi:hypothetical protein
MNIDDGKSIEQLNNKEIINCCAEFRGGQTKTPTNFREKRNKYIKFNKVYYFFIIQLFY